MAAPKAYLSDRSYEPAAQQRAAQLGIAHCHVLNQSAFDPNGTGRFDPAALEAWDDGHTPGPDFAGPIVIDVEEGKLIDGVPGDSFYFDALAADLRKPDRFNNFSRARGDVLAAIAGVRSRWPDAMVSWYQHPLLKHHGGWSFEAHWWFDLIAACDFLTCVCYDYNPAVTFDAQVFGETLRIFKALSRAKPVMALTSRLMMRGEGSVLDLAEYAANVAAVRAANPWAVCEWSSFEDYHTPFPGEEVPGHELRAVRENEQIRTLETLWNKTQPGKDLKVPARLEAA